MGERCLGVRKVPARRRTAGEPGILAEESRRVVALPQIISYVGYEMRFQHEIMQ
jgi:hypothetical protein